MIGEVTSSAAHGRDESTRPRTSEILRGILAQNPNARTFSVERILSSIGPDQVEASLLMFSIPSIAPVPMSSQAGPAGALGLHLMTGEKQVRIPRFILRKSVTRRALAVAIHTVLPVLEAAEKVVRPRWSWISHPTARRAIGLFVFLLAIAIAFPLVGFNPLHATSIFVMALGMAEQDGLAVLIGIAMGVLSFVLLAASGMSARALRMKASKWLQKVARKLGIKMLANFLQKVGYKRLARLLTFQWSQLLLAWDPEKSSGRSSAKVAPKALAKITVPPASSGLAALHINGAVPVLSN